MKVPGIVIYADVSSPYVVRDPLISMPQGQDHSFTITATDSDGLTSAASTAVTAMLKIDVDPTVDISTLSHAGSTVTVRFTFAEATMVSAPTTADPNAGMALDPAKYDALGAPRSLLGNSIKVTKDAAGTMLATTRQIPNGMPSNNPNVFDVTIDYTGDSLPLYVTFKVAEDHASAITIDGGALTFVPVAANMSTPALMVASTPIGLPTLSPPEAHTSVSIPLSGVTGLGMLGPNEFVVLARNRQAAGILPGLPSQVVEMSLVNLHDFFMNQGTISLHGPSPHVYNDVVISEIMWGLDDSLTVREHSEWIELYNTTKQSIDLSGFELMFHGNRVADNVWWDASARCIDVVGNAGAAERRVPDALLLPKQLFRAHWVDGALPWTVKGQGGQSIPGAPAPGTQNIVSMTRLINFDRVENHADSKRDDRFVADPGRKKGLPFGYQDGNWIASEHRNAWIATGRIATPGTRPESPSVRPPKTAPSQSVIINEIGNSANSAHDWIEFYDTRTSGDAINLKNWRVSYVYNTGTDSAPIGREITVLTFPNNDNIKIKPGEYLVIAASHPTNEGNDLAAGIDITKAAANQLRKGLGERGSKVANYGVVSNLNIPNEERKALFILRNSKDDWKLGTVENVIDVTGTAFIPLHAQHPSGWTGYSANRRVFYSTEVWPLQNWSKGHGDVITDGPPEDFRAGFVYARRAKNSGIGEHHVFRHGYTGVGYDRHAPANLENGGTPGLFQP